MVSYESIRRWVLTFGPAIARRLRARRPKPHSGGTWMRCPFGWVASRCISGALLMRKARSSTCSFRPSGTQAPEAHAQAAEAAGHGSDEWVTDKRPAYGAALRGLKLQEPHTRRKRANNRAESSHVPVRRRERKLQGSSRPARPSGSCPCTQPPTTPSPFLVISLPLALTASSKPRRSPRGAKLRV